MWNCSGCPPVFPLIHGGGGGVVGALSVEAGGAPGGRGRVKGDGEGVAPPRRLSASLNQQLRRFSRETGDGGIHVGSGGCVDGLYSHVGPLGLKVLHAGQNLLLVTGQGHTHLSQFARR